METIGCRMPQRFCFVLLLNVKHASNLRAINGNKRKVQQSTYRSDVVESHLDKTHSHDAAGTGRSGSGLAVQ